MKNTVPKFLLPSLLQSSPSAAGTFDLFWGFISLQSYRPGMMSEAASYDHLVPEVITRLSHLITEIRNFPVELKEQEEYGQVVSDYMKTYSEV